MENITIPEIKNPLENINLSFHDIYEIILFLEQQKSFHNIELSDSCWAMRNTKGVKIDENFFQFLEKSLEEELHNKNISEEEYMKTLQKIKNERVKLLNKIKEAA